jgi:prepilin-type N-terminal cleavage/methylation domain-containing protein
MLTKLRNRQKGFTLIELLIVVAIIGIIAALLIPNFLDALQKAKQKRTVSDEKNTGTALMSWLTDQQGAAAAGATATVDITKYGSSSSAAGIESVLVPQYTQLVPEKDGWKHLYKYWIDTTANTTNHAFAIASGGADTCSCGTYTVGAFDPTDYNQDIAWADGYFVRWPQNLGGSSTP